jgi:putative ABC transport system ATP-binding protein
MNGNRIVDGVSFALHEGESATIEGASGSGKTTFLRILATLVEPDAGTVLLDGTDARAIAPSVFRSRVAYVLQESPMFEGTVAENVATGPRLRGVTMTAAAIASALERVGLVDFEGRIARELSGGERQRVALARALANEPEVLLLDEPTSALDRSSAQHVVSLVRSLAEGGLAVALVTHIAEHASALGGRRLLFEAGRLREETVPRSVAP